jgi:predicted metal-dependent hydrolase
MMVDLVWGVASDMGNLLFAAESLGHAIKLAERTWRDLGKIGSGEELRTSRLHPAAM